METIKKHRIIFLALAAFVVFTILYKIKEHTWLKEDEESKKKTQHLDSQGNEDGSLYKSDGNLSTDGTGMTWDELVAATAASEASDVNTSQESAIQNQAPESSGGGGGGGGSDSGNHDPMYGHNFSQPPAPVSNSQVLAGQIMPRATSLIPKSTFAALGQNTPIHFLPIKPFQITPVKGTISARSKKTKR